MCAAVVVWAYGVIDAHASAPTAMSPGTSTHHKIKQTAYQDETTDWVVKFEYQLALR